MNLYTTILCIACGDGLDGDDWWLMDGDDDELNVRPQSMAAATAAVANSLALVEVEVMKFRIRVSRRLCKYWFAVPCTTHNSTVVQSAYSIVALLLHSHSYHEMPFCHSIVDTFICLFRLFYSVRDYMLQYFFHYL